MANGTKNICFFLGDQQFAAAIAHVKETIVLRPITRVFLVPPWLAGIINLRGDVVGIIDLGAFLGLPRAPQTPATRILIARVPGNAGGPLTAGLIVDRLADVRVFSHETLEPPPSTLTGETAALLDGVLTLPGGAPLLVLDLVKLFDSERMAFARRVRPEGSDGSQKRL